MSSSFALFSPPASLRTNAGAIAATAAPFRRLPLDTALRWAAVVAICMSTEYLFQPFVWKNWPVDEVLLGWLDVVRDRLVVATAIALALAGATRAPARRVSRRAFVVAIAIVVGASAGEAMLLATGWLEERADVASVLGRVVQWSGLALCVAGAYYLRVRSNEARARARANEISRSTAEALLLQTQLQTLRQQIEPHFLFNTLATIRRLQETEPDAGGRLLRHLIDYLQSSMRAAAPRATLGHEVDLVSSYLAIVATRMSGRLTVSIDVPDALRPCECPPLALATLVENAVKHGITPAPDGGAIGVRARRIGATLEITVADTGVGFSGSGPSALGGTGIGLANTRARLRALYGSSGMLSITGNAPRGVLAVIRFPARCREHR